MNIYYRKYPKCNRKSKRRWRYLYIFVRHIYKRLTCQENNLADNYEEEKTLDEMKSSSNITDQIIEYIHSNIENGNWPVGTKIESEPKIAQTLGVSRASVRVAIRQFVALGILESIQGKGTFVVSTKTPDSFVGNSGGAVYCSGRDVTEFRLLLEPEICELAAKRITEGEILELRDSIDKMMETGDEDYEGFLEWDDMFHLILAKACKNPLIERTMVNLVKLRYPQTLATRKGLGKYVGYYYHQKILAAIEQKKPQQARSLMEEHIQMICRVLPRESK